MFDVVDRDCKAESSGEYISHICHTDDLAGQIEQRAARIARIDIGVGLYIEKSFEGPVLRADDAVGDGSFEPERIANREDFLAGFDMTDITEINGRDLRIAEILDL